MSSNRILSRLAAADLALLEPHLQPVELPVHRALESRNRRIDHVYFIEAGFASVIANGSSKPSIEVGIIGREGMTGLAIVMGQTVDAADHPRRARRTSCNAPVMLRRGGQARWVH
jgi:CRP-like cAMP-binding protein